MATQTMTDTSKFETELRKASAESGWNAESERLVLLRFIAAGGGNLTAFQSFLREQISEESFVVSGPAYHGAVATEETDDDEDFDDEDDDDLDDEEDDDDFDDEDDLDEEDDDDDDFDDEDKEDDDEE